MNDDPKIPPREGKLLSGILNDAEEEAKRIIEEAKADALRKLNLSKEKAEAIHKEAEDRAQTQCDAIRRFAEQNVSIETKRLSLKAREETLSTVLDRVKEKLEKMISTPDYRSVLAGWIAEAAMGLSGDEFSVSTSAKELPLIDDALLKQAEKTVKDVSARDVKIKLDSTPKDAQGIVLASSDGKTAFNNQVPTRILRYQSQIRKVLYTELFKD